MLTVLLPWRDEHALLLGVVGPSTCSGHSAITLGVAFDTGLEFGAEVADETL